MRLELSLSPHCSVQSFLSPFPKVKKEKRRNLLYWTSHLSVIGQTVQIQSQNSLLLIIHKPLYNAEYKMIFFSIWALWDIPTALPVNGFYL